MWTVYFTSSLHSSICSYFLVLFHFLCSFWIALIFFVCRLLAIHTLVSSKDLGIIFKDEFWCAHFHKAAGRYMAQRLGEAVGGLRWPRVGVMWQLVRLGGTPTTGSWKIARLTSAPVSLTFLPSRSLSERITSLRNVYQRDASFK